MIFNNVTKRYDNGTVALDDVSFFIDKGEFVFIVGSSGAGKSTITKLILCEEQPTGGTVLINGINLKDLKHREMPFYRRQIGIVFQDFRLLPNKSVYDNIAFAMQVRNATTKEIRRAIPNVLSMVGLSHKAKVRPDSFRVANSSVLLLRVQWLTILPCLLPTSLRGTLIPQRRLILCNCLKISIKEAQPHLRLPMQGIL